MDGFSSACPIMQAMHVASFDNILTIGTRPTMQKLPSCILYVRHIANVMETMH